MKPFVYLDYNATAPLRPEARAAVLAALEGAGNPSSVHGAGRRARALVEGAREAVAGAVAAKPAEVVFTSGATEALNMALLGAGAASVLASAIEHDAVLKAVPEAIRIPVTTTGVVDVAALQALLATAPKPALVAVMAVNNETGVIQPLAEVAALVKAAGGLLLVDGVQALGRIPFAFTDIDYLTLSSHKIGGPQGVGALVVREGRPLLPHTKGGGQEKGRRAGTENVAGIAGFGAAASAAMAGLTDFQAMAPWREALEVRLQAAGGVVIGRDAPRVANTLCIARPGLKAQLQLMALDLAGVAVSSGAACSSGKVARSHVLAAMGLPPEVQESAIRLSFGWQTEQSDLQIFFEKWTEMAASAIQ